NGVVHNYTVDGIKVLQETYNDGTEHILNFYYDENDSPIAFSINDTMYYYGKNLQGDVVKIYTTNGEVVAEYTYDAWGKLLTITDVNGTVISDITSPAVVNPIRYRGYYYDVETGFYYLNSRYYDSGLGRFLNADDMAFLGVSGTVLGYNLYGYCENEPVKHIDKLGYLAWPGEIHRYVQNILSLYIWLFLGCFTYSDYFIRFNRYKYGFADLYAKRWKEIWEVKPNKKSYKTSGPKQLKKYLDGISGSKKGRNLGTFKTYYHNYSGFYEVKIYSNSNDGMIYYDYNYSWKVNTTILLAVTSIALIATGAGSSVGVPMLSRLLLPM
ncbi:MAG: RHS repeat-associated core domain-containing protein, partial [Clostridia bacterium]|nr:RHS repeat-associated core domain-containing protein [Clostridia bacterium]